jgi:glycosyltransferase involved in cell wall biosynthesis
VEVNRVPAARVESVPTGMDPARYRPGSRAAARATLGLPDSGTLVGIVATLRSWKGHRFLLEAMRQIPEAISLVIVGDGPQRAALEAQVRSLGLDSRVRMAGNQADVVPWLHALDLFALPSYANEGVPQALVQAMLCGLPCITTTAGSISELARHEVTALVVPPRDAHALAEAIRRLAADEGLRRELGEAARRHCVENFSYERMLDRMEAIYREVSGG